MFENRFLLYQKSCPHFQGGVQGDFGGTMLIKKKQRKSKYLLTASAKLKGRGVINLRNYPYLGIGVLEFPNGKKTVCLTQEQYVELRNNKDIVLKNV